MSIALLTGIGSKALSYIMKPTTLVIIALVACLGWQMWTKHSLEVDLAKSQTEVAKAQADFDKLNAAYDECKGATEAYDAELSKKNAAIDGLKSKESIVAADQKKQVAYWKGRYEAALKRIATVPVEEMKKNEGVVDRETSNDYVRDINDRLGL